MSYRIDTPVNQVRQTNVAVVKVKKGAKRFEVACYPNTVLSWRNGYVENLDDVLHTRKVFSNVSKGQYANKKDLKEMFQTNDEEQICKLILKKGELHLAEKERHIVQEQVWREILHFVTYKCLNPETRRPYPIGMVERALRESHFAVNINKPTKRQALEAIRSLQRNHFPIQRAQMRLAAVLSDQQLSRAFKKLLRNRDGVTIEREQSADGGGFRITFLTDPGLFRELDEFLQSRGCGSPEVIDSSVQEEGDARITQIQPSKAIPSESNHVDDNKDGKGSDDNDDNDNNDKNIIHEEKSKESQVLENKPKKQLSRKERRQLKKQKRKKQEQKQNENQHDEDNDDIQKIAEKMDHLPLANEEKGDEMLMNANMKPSSKRKKKNKKKKSNAVPNTFELLETDE